MNKKIIKKLMAKPNVISVGRGIKLVGGTGTNVEAIIVGVKKKVPLEELKPGDVVPKAIGKDLTDVVEMGEIKLQADRTRTRKWRPAPGGVSIGHILVTAGTLGACVKKGGEVFILSNNHVLANTNQAQIGDPIVQPGIYDFGTPDDIIGKLHQFVPISKAEESDCPLAGTIVELFNWLAGLFRRKTRLGSYVPSTDNLVDCALAKPDNPADVLMEILDIGTPTGVVEPELGMIVKKSGRTSLLTHGIITQVDMTIDIDFDGELVTFKDQIAISGSEVSFSAPGDSGSTILDRENKFVGLLFAGSDVITIANRFSNVVEGLELDPL